MALVRRNESVDRVEWATVDGWMTVTLDHALLDAAADRPPFGTYGTRSGTWKVRCVPNGAALLAVAEQMLRPRR